MISVVIPTLEAEQGLPMCLSALVPGVVAGTVLEVLVVDGGSHDRSCAIADQAGATVVKSEPGRGTQLAAGALKARGAWLLFLHADTVLETGWEREVQSLLEKVESGARRSSAYAFGFALDDDGVAPRILESLVWVRSVLLGFPYGDQGLLISRKLFDEVGGYRSVALMEDLDIVRRLGWRRISVLRSHAITSAARYNADGYVWRVFRNQVCLVMYMLGFSSSRIARFYHRTCSK